jgi:cysteine desulfuration protein SufE
MLIKEIQEEIIDEFSMFDDWMQRYEYIIDLGKNLPLIKDEFKTDDNIIKGCQSKVWLKGEQNNEKIVFTADSDAILTKGIIAILIRTFSNQKASDILEANMDFIDEIGLKEHLSPTRANGLVSMIKQIKMYALAFNSKINSMEQEIDTTELGEKIVKILKTIYDPEIPVDIYELGLIYDVMVNTDYEVKILMTLTSPNCPVAESLPREVEDKVKSLENIKDAEVEITFDPPWSKDLMSEEAKLELGML